jgi:signal transduction histidine kinase
MKLDGIFSRTLTLRRAAATIFALSALIPLLLFLATLWRYDLVSETEVQVGLFLALIIALLGFLVFQRMVERISKLAQSVAMPMRLDLDAPLPEAEVPTVAGLGPVAEIGQIADAFSNILTNLRASTERLEDLVFKLGTLNEMVELAARIPKIQDLLGIVLERTMRTVRATIGSIMLLDEERQVLKVVAARGLPEEVVGGVELPMGAGIAGKVAELGEPVIVDNIETDPRFAKPNDPRYGGGSFICMPARIGERIIGVINLSKKEYRTLSPPDLRSFSPTDLQFLNALMAYVAYALDNARLLDEARQAASRLQDVVHEQQVRLTVAQQQVLQAEKLSALSQVVAGVAHELNNPLSVVAGQTSLLRQMVGGGPLAERAEKIAQAADRCARIVRNFLTLARQHPPERQRVRLNQIIREAVELLAYPLRVDDVEVALDLGENLPVIWADPNQLHQVVVNLINNAHHAMRETPPPRRLSVTTRYDPGQGRLSFRVADTGPGIPAEIQGRVFEPFFTTKPTEQGTGLGLSICNGIIESHGGTIGVESQPGQGAAFWIELPVGELPGPAPESGASESAPPIRGRAILVVDDELEVAEVLADMLAGDGHQVETAANGALGLEKLGKRAYDLILCDIKMPELDGPGLYREVEGRHPGLSQRFIFLTGDTLSAETREFLRETGASCLSKPFAPAEVHRLTQQVLQAQ